MRVALFGGTGFVGSYLIDALLHEGHQPVVLVRAGSEARLHRADECIAVAGGLESRTAIAATLRDCDAAIYLVGILRENPSAGITFKALQYDAARLCMETALEQGVARFLLMSANGARADGTPYQQSKFAAEEFLLQSGLQGTAFRPSVIFGDPRGRMEFCTQLLRDMIVPPLPAPAFFSGFSVARGGFAMSPVAVTDVASAFTGALRDSAFIGKVYPLGGLATLSWPDIIRTIATASGRRKWIVPVPAAPVLAVCRLLDRFPWFPLTRDQLRMLLEGNTVESGAAFDQLNMRPRRFAVEELSYLAR
jgi:uncharacterized protein YbjT (DUF2867 family)